MAGQSHFLELIQRSLYITKLIESLSEGMHLQHPQVNNRFKGVLRAD